MHRVSRAGHRTALCVKSKRSPVGLDVQEARSFDLTAEMLTTPVIGVAYCARTHWLRQLLTSARVRRLDLDADATRANRVVSGRHCRERRCPYIFQSGRMFASTWCGRRPDEASWHVDGNAGINPGAHFLGTTAALMASNTSSPLHARRVLYAVCGHDWVGEQLHAPIHITKARISTELVLVGARNRAGPPPPAWAMKWLRSRRRMIPRPGIVTFPYQEFRKCQRTHEN